MLASISDYMTTGVSIVRFHVG